MGHRVGVERCRPADMVTRPAFHPTARAMRSARRDRHATSTVEAFDRYTDGRPPHASVFVLVYGASTAIAVATLTAVGSLALSLISH